MPEILGEISRWNDAGFEVVIDSYGTLFRIRCSMNLWQNFKRNFKPGDFVMVDFTRVGQEETKVARSMVRREDLRP